MPTIFQRLQDAEINFVITAFYDAGFDVKLGDSINGFRDETRVTTWEEVAPWLDKAARKHFPKSRYARRGSQ